MRRNFDNPGLTRLIRGWLPAGAESSRQDVAERLGPWFGVADVIALDELHRAVGAPDGGEPAGLGEDMPPASAIAQDLLAARSRVEEAIAAADVFGGTAGEGGFAPVHRSYLQQQRRMATAVEPLRERARQALQGGAGRLARLAALDAGMERLLGLREQRLLGALPLLLKQRYGQLCEPAADDAFAIAAAEAGRVAFEREFRQLLLAELELRLQPVAGMIDALRNEATHTP